MESFSGPSRPEKSGKTVRSEDGYPPWQTEKYSSENKETFNVPSFHVHEHMQSPSGPLEAAGDELVDKKEDAAIKVNEDDEENELNEPVAPSDAGNETLQNKEGAPSEEETDSNESAARGVPLE